MGVPPGGEAVQYDTLLMCLEHIFVSLLVSKYWVKWICVKDTNCVCLSVCSFGVLHSILSVLFRKLLTSSYHCHVDWLLVFSSSLCICCTDQPTSKFGEKLKEQVEERLHFYETGTTPRKNTDVMREAIAEAKAVLVTAAEGTPGGPASSSEKKKKKKKKRISELEESGLVQAPEELLVEEMETDSRAASAKKKKKHKKSLETEA